MSFVKKQYHGSSSSKNMVTLELSRVVLALAVLATASSELADDFNIPEGWRMEVNGMLGYPYCAKLPFQTSKHVLHVLHLAPGTAAPAQQAPFGSLVECSSVWRHVRKHYPWITVQHCSAACNRGILNAKSLLHTYGILSALLIDRQYTGVHRSHVARVQPNG